MSDSAKSDPAPHPQHVVTIDGALTAATAETWRTHILDTPFATHGICIDVGRVTDCDTLGLQVLVSAARSAALASVPFSIAGATDSFSQACASLGLNFNSRPAPGGNRP